MCPFCYLGKRKFDAALNQFAQKDSVRVVWKSFQLQPDMKTDTSISIFEHLSQTKGWSVEQARQMSANIVQSGARVGLDYRFDDIVVANTFKAHLLLHLAKSKGVQHKTKELLLEAYFHKGINVDDSRALVEIGESAGLNPDDVESALTDNATMEAVRNDIAEARQLGIQGVPFFVFDRKYAVSGAQETETFLQVMEQAYQELLA